MRGLSLSVAVLAAVCAAQAEDAKSGPKSGEDVPPFHVLDVTGPSKGQELCYRCKFGDAPVVAVFTAKVDDNLGKFLKELDGALASAKKVNGLVVVVTEDVAKTTAQLTALAKQHGLKNLPLTIYKSKEGPADFNLDLKAAATVVLWKESVFRESVAIVDSGKIRAKAILGAVGKLAD